MGPCDSGSTYWAPVARPVLGVEVEGYEESSEAPGGGYELPVCELEDDDDPSFSRKGGSELTKRGRFVGLETFPFPLPLSMARRLLGRVSSAEGSAIALIMLDEAPPSSSSSSSSTCLGAGKRRAFLRTRTSFRIRIFIP